jgi:phosphoglucosamine mutase
VQRVTGRFEQAEVGTLFLDEIGDMPPEAQTRLLRVLQDGRYTSVGGRNPIKADVRIVETAVGDRYVLEALERDGLVLGGEQSGHIILRDRATTGDGLLAGLVLLQTAQDSGMALEQLANAAMTSFPQVLVNVRTARRDPAVAELVADEIRATETALGGRGRVLVRPSGTEPLVRVMVEAATEDQARHEAERLAAVIAQRLA